MATQKLSATRVKGETKPGMLSDGGGLYLQVSPSGGKSWIYRYKLNGRTRKQGLGPYPTVSLSEARKRADASRALKEQGIDPIEHERARERAEAIEQANTKTFKDCAEDYIALHEHEWSNAKHVYQWRQSLEHNAYPVMKHLPVDAIGTPEVLQVLEPIWISKTETATRVRQRMEAIFDYARVKGLRDGENPARWKGHLEHSLPKPTKVRRVVHHPAMGYFDVPDYYRTLRKKDTLSAHALAFIISTATRSNETRSAQWEEFDLDAKVWTIPAERIKSRREFRIPLTDEAIAILEDARPFERDGFVFPSTAKGKAISDVAVRKALKAAHPDVSIHGFRSTFRDWCAEQTNFAREIAEAALAHVLESKTEAAYQRGDLLEKRRVLMEAWSRHLATFESESATVAALGARHG